jgi:cysteinyl-tRNA synthetase
VVGVPAAFAAALDDDLGVPQALAVVHDTVRAGNAALASGDSDAARIARDEVVAMVDVLGVNPYAEPWAAQSDDGAARRALAPLVDVVLAQRQAARDRKDFAVADALRDGLASSGIVVEDTPAGARWSLAEES